MPQSNELRVFVSSTFRDLQEEREHLVKKIFPEIRAVCRDRAVIFTDIDLRWGLTREEAERGGVIAICMQEIERCRPYFIGILGGRYGWVPPREQTDDAEFAERHPWLAAAVDAGLSITEMEFQYGALLHQRGEVDAFFYLRNPDVTPPDFTESDEALATKLDRLKSQLRDSGYSVREEFRTPEELGEQIRTDLLAIIDERFPADETPSPAQQERRAHEAFARTRSAAYVPDESTVARLDALVAAGSQGICVTAPSGTGKSALLAYWSEKHRRDNPDHHVIEHYVGATASAREHIGLMLRLITEIKEIYGVEQELPESSEEIERDFPAWLAYARDRKLVVAIDAVNQLPSLGQELRWLPEFILPAVTFVISTTEGPPLEALRARQYAMVEVNLLSEKQRATVIERYLSGFRKRLTEDQVGRIAASPNTRSPLFLRTVLEELRVFGVFEQLDERIDYFLAAEHLDDLFHRVLERMEEDYDPELVQQTMMYIRASRRGLTESELQDLLNMDPPLEGMSGRTHNRLDFSAFLMVLDYHLMRSAGLLNFFHAYLRRAVEARYLEPKEQELAGGELRRYQQSTIHNRLARYFESLAPTLRSTLELLHALEQLGDRPRMHQLISTIERFEELWSTQPHEVLRLWAGSDPQAMAAAYRAGVEAWVSAETPSVERQAVVLGLIIEAHEAVADWSEAERVQQDRLLLLRGLNDRAAESRALSSLAWLALNLGRMEAADHFAQSGLHIALQLGDQQAIAYALTNRGNLQQRCGEYDAALECFRACEEVARELGDRRGVAHAVGNRGNVHAVREQYDEALRCYRQSEQIAREMGDRRGITQAVGNRGMVHNECREYDEALECFREQEEIARQLGDRKSVGAAVGNRGTLQLDRGEYVEALGCFREQEEIARQLGNRGGAAIAVGNRGSVHMYSCEYDEALVCFEQAAAEHRSIGFLHGLTYWLQGTARVLVELAEREGAMPEYLGKYLADITADGWRVVVLQTARERAGESLAISRDLPKPDTLFESQLLLARVTAAEGDLSAALAILQSMLPEAGDDSDRAELHYWLWKLNVGESGHRAEALRLYTAITEKTSTYADRRRIEELTGSATATEPPNATA